jgi:hypothetical protein
MKTNIESCLSDIADWYIKSSKQFIPAELNAIIRKYFKSLADEQYVLTYLGTRQGKTHFKRVMLERLKLVKYVQKSNGALISVESWEREKEGMIRRGETPPLVKYLNEKPSELREAPIKATKITDVNQWAKNMDMVYPQVQFGSGNWKDSKVYGGIQNLLRLLKPGDTVFVKKVTLEKTLFYSVENYKGEIEITDRSLLNEESSNLREPVFEDVESCYIIPSRYRDLLPFLDMYPVGSFLIEPSVAPGTAKIDAILQKLKDGVTSIQDSTLFREYLLTMSKFWSYSVGNLILIMLQKRDASRVAGFTTWKELGRFVKAGEKGIMILAPCLPPKGGYEFWARGNDKYSVRFLEGQWYTYNINEKKGAGGPFKSKVEAESDLARQGFSKVKEEAEIYEAPRYFKVVYVFDVSQTTGKELPVIEVKSLTGAANPELWDKMMALLKRKGVNMSFESRPDQNPEIKGQFLMPDNIWIRPEESEAQQLKTIIHEAGHYYTESVFGISRADAETIAESVAFVVGAHFGFDSGTRSFSYVAVWSQDKKVLERNLASIKNVSGSILNDLGAQ